MNVSSSSAVITGIKVALSGFSSIFADHKTIASSVFCVLNLETLKSLDKMNPSIIVEENKVDDISTKNLKETRKDIVVKSFKEAISMLNQELGNNMDTWTWNRVHTIEHEHPIGKVAALRSYFNVGPFEINGTKEVINNLAFSYDETGKYRVSSGPSTRRIIDFSDIENSLSILPTGQSGNMFSPFYEDQADMYNKGEFRKMLMNLEAIKNVSKNILILK